MYFVQVQISFQGAGKRKPRRTNSQTQAAPPANCIFPRLKHFCLCSCNYLLHCSFSLTSVLPPHFTHPFQSPTKDRGLKLPEVTKLNHKQTVWQYIQFHCHSHFCMFLLSVPFLQPNVHGWHQDEKTPTFFHQKSNRQILLNIVAVLTPMWEGETPAIEIKPQANLDCN